MYHKTSAAAGNLIVIEVHINDCTITASQPRLVEDFKVGLSKHVEVTDLGELHWMLGIKVKQDHTAGTIHLSQQVYINSILNCFNFTNLKPLSIPMDVQVKLSSEQAPTSAAKFTAMCDIPYHKAVGALNWAALAMHQTYRSPFPLWNDSC